MYYRMLGFGDRDRLKLLESLAIAAAPRLHAIVGLHGQMTVALAQGVRHSCRMGHVDPTKRLLCFHWGCGSELQDCKGTLAWIDQRARKQRRRHELLDITSFVRTEEVRDGWQHAITQLVAAGAESQFGLLFHLGGGQSADIAGDFDVLLPMIGDDTLVVLCDVRTGGVAKRYREMVEREGWNGIKIGGLAVLQRPAYAKEMSDGLSS